MSPAELWTALKDAYAFHRRAWFIHFEVMYVLTANYLAFYALAEEIGLSGSQVSSFLSGQQTFYARTDEELWRLAGLARVARRGLGADARVARRHARAGCWRCRSGSTWLAEFDAFLAVYGQRIEETCRIDTPSWIEDPTPALYSIGTFLAKPAGFDFHAARAAAVAERDAQIDAGAAVGQRRRPDAVQRGARVEPGRQLRLVERGAQLPDRPAGRDPGAPGHARARRAADRRGTHLGPDGPVLPVQAGAVRGDGPVQRVGGSSWAELRGDDPGPAGLLRALARTRALAADRCSARSPTRCPTRS